MTSADDPFRDLAILNEIQELAASLSDQRTQGLLQSALDAVALNPQPEPPGIDDVALNPQPLPPIAEDAIDPLNPQPLPPIAEDAIDPLNPQPLPPIADDSPLFNPEPKIHPDVQEDIDLDKRGG